MTAPRLYLASASPRRSQLLQQIEVPHVVRPVVIDESPRDGEAPAAYVLRLAEQKAQALWSQLAPGERLPVLAADTTVAIEGAILGKPADVVEAEQMLKRLRGHTHQVYTGIAALRVRDGKLVTDLCVTDVPMRNYSDDEIEAYIQTGDPLDKAGAYAIQHPRFQPVEKLSGCFASVMGLPLCHLVRTLRQLDLPPAADVPTSCQTYLDYQCPVSRAILRGENVG